MKLLQVSSNICKNSKICKCPSICLRCSIKSYLNGSFSLTFSLIEEDGCTFGYVLTFFVEITSDP